MVEISLTIRSFLEYLYLKTHLNNKELAILTEYLYFVVQKLKTRVVRNNINPEWNDDLTLSILDASLPVKLTVYDRDFFSFDDKMGDAEFEIGSFLEAVKMHLGNMPSGTIIRTIQPSRENCLAEESRIIWSNGKVVQNMFLRLRNVERGEIELQLEWIDIPGSRGL